MSQNKVTIDLLVRDLASRPMEGLGSTIRNNALAANLMSSAIVSGVNAAASAVGGFTSKLQEAADLQLSNASSAGAFAALTGKSFTEGQEFIGRFSSEMAKVAAALPGETQQYVNLGLAIQDNLIPAFKDASGAFDSSAFEKELGVITRGMGVLGAASKVATADVSKFTSKFLGGSSISELQQLLFAEANPAFLSLVEKKLATTGKKLEDLTVSERKEIIKAVSQQLVTPEVIQAAGGSVAGLIATLQSNLFDQTTGLFGFMRDLDKKTKGDQSVLTAINEGLELLIGEKGLLNTIGQTLKALGIEFGDPMANLRNGILDFNKKIKGVRDWLLKINRDLTPEDFGLIQEQIGEWLVKSFDFSQISTGAANWINGLMQNANQIDWNATFESFGKVAAHIFNELTNSIGNFLSKVDWNGVASFVGRIIHGLFYGLGALITNLNWGNVAVMIGALLFGQIVIGIGIVAAGIVGTMGLIPVLVGAAILGLIAVVVRHWDSIKGFFSDRWNEITEAVSGALENLKKGWNDLIENSGSRISNAIGNLFSSVGNWVTDQIRKIPGVGALVPQNTPSPSPNSVPNRAGGFLPSGINGLIASALRESSQMPSGSNLVVANDSEMILNRRQQTVLASNLNQGQSRNGGGIVIQSLSIHTAATDAKGIANDIMNELASAYDRYAQNRLTTSTS